LRKDREQRYQHVKDLLIDLKDLKQELEFEAKLKGAPAFVVPPSGGSVGARELPPEGGTTNATPEEIATKETAAASTTSSAEIILGEIKRHKVGVLIGLSVMLVTVSALAYGLYRIFAPRESAPHFQKVKFTRLTSLGNAKSAAISPDGRFIAYVQYENGRYSLWTKAVTTGSAVQIVPPTEVEDIHHTAFSPDGDYVYYLLTEINREDVLYQIPVLGGTPKKVAKDVLSPITFSPDGQQFAFTRKVETDYRVIVMKADSSAERILKPKMLNFFPSWSPDGKTIATGLFKDVQQMTVVGVDVQTETLKPLTRQTWARVGRIAWLKDLSGLLLAARERPEENVQLWKLSLPSGEASRITNDLNDYGIDEELRLGYARNFFPNLSITADSRALVTTQSELSSSIWVVPVNKNQPARQLTFRGQTRDGYFGLVGTADGRIVYASTAGSNYTLWVMDGDGSRARQLTDARASDRFPAISPDGRYIIFSSNRAGQNNLWRIEMDGSNPKQLTKGKYDTDPSFSPDGRWLFYAGASPSTGLFALWKVSIEGGDPVQITEAGRWPAVSPDGQWIAYNYYDRQSLRTRAAIMPIAGGAPVKVLEYTSTRPRVRWSPDGQSLIYTGTDQGGTNLWRLPLDGGPPQKLTDFKSEQIYHFDLSGDGKQFLIARGTTTSDVVLISDVK